MAFTFADLEKLEPGARFYTADLHVHTFGGSSDVQDPHLTVEAIVDAAVAANVGLLALTDHNSDKHVLDGLAYAAKYADRLLVLPGVEVTSATGHLLVYGNPSKPNAIANFVGDNRPPGREGRTRHAYGTINGGRHIRS